MQKITMRGVMLAAGFVLGSAALNAQGVTSLEGQVYTPVQLVDGGKYVIKNVGSNEGRQGWMFEQDGRLRIDVDNKDNDVSVQGRERQLHSLRSWNELGHDDGRSHEHYGGHEGG